MSLNYKLYTICIIGILVGCGNSHVANPDAIPEDFPPHGGIWRRLGGQKGVSFIEVVQKKGNEPNTPQVTVYFYNNDFSPSEIAPDSGVLWLDSTNNVKLEPNEEGALVTPPGSVLLAKSGIEGATLSVELGGEETKIRLLQSER